MNQNKNSIQFYFAEILSWVSNPAFLGLIILFISIIRSPMDINTRIFWLLFASILNGLIPLIFYLFLIKSGRPVEGTLANKAIQKNRVLIFLLFFIIMALQIIVLIFTKPYQPLLLVVTGGALASFVGLAITSFWRISMHSGVATIFIITIFYLFGFHNTWPILIMLPLIFWSRIYLSRHTFWQLLGGVIAAFLVVTLAFYIYGFNIFKIFLN